MTESSTKATPQLPCPRKCVVCVDADHHWMVGTRDDQEVDTVIMVCKHCDATREADDDDEY